ncbi:MAG: hypothetical protein M3Y91_01130 [Actinomycetota bacterium]|nr:hypothetical protein [Actinomycetota bacterium]
MVIAVASHLQGLPLSALGPAVDTVLAHPDAIALPVVGGTREEVWAVGCVLADEERIASLADALSTGHGPAVSDEAAACAAAGLEEELGGQLTDTQRHVAEGLLTGVVGITASTWWSGSPALGRPPPWPRTGPGSRLPATA